MRALLVGGPAALIGCGTALGPGGAGTADAGHALDDGERAAIYATLALEADATGRVRNDCGEWTRPALRFAELGGEVGRALVVVLFAGPVTPGCYGQSGEDFTLLRVLDDGYKEIFTASGLLVVLPSEHGGVWDIAVDGPGGELPVFEWSGEAYRRARTLSERPAPRP